MEWLDHSLRQSLLQSTLVRIPLSGITCTLHDGCVSDSIFAHLCSSLFFRLCPFLLFDEQQLS